VARTPQYLAPFPVPAVRGNQLNRTDGGRHHTTVTRWFGAAGRSPAWRGTMPGPAWSCASRATPRSRAAPRAPRRAWSSSWSRPGRQCGGTRPRSATSGRCNCRRERRLRWSCRPASVHASSSASCSGKLAQSARRPATVVNCNAYHLAALVSYEHLASRHVPSPPRRASKDGLESAEADHAGGPLPSSCYPQLGGPR
jgi:hypothetical protein